MGAPARRVAGITLVVLASLCAFLAVLALWVNRQVLNTENWTATSSRLLEQPRIRTQLSGFLVDRLYANVDVAQELRAVLPAPLDAAAGPAAAGLQDVAQRAADGLLQRPRVQVLWENANRAAHRQLLRLLEGGGPVVSTQGGAVTLDLRAMLGEMEQRVGVGGRVASALPAAAAHITILRSDQLSLAQSVLKALRGFPVVLLGLTLALFGGALLIAPRRRRETVRGYGLGLMAAGVGGLLLRSLGGNAIIDAAVTTAAVKPAAHDAWTIATTLLAQAAGAAVFYGAALVAGAWLAGRTRPAAALRRLAAPYARQPAMAYGVLTLIVLVVLLWAPTPALRNPVTAILLVVLLGIGFEVLRRQIVREHPDAATGGPTAWLRARLHGGDGVGVQQFRAQEIAEPVGPEVAAEGNGGDAPAP
jgi:hypothetical protein